MWSLKKFTEVCSEYSETFAEKSQNKSKSKNQQKNKTRIKDWKYWEWFWKGT